MLQMVDKDQDGYKECIGLHTKPTPRGLIAYRMPYDIIDNNTGEVHVKKGDTLVTLDSALDELSCSCRRLERAKIMIQAQKVQNKY